MKKKLVKLCNTRPTFSCDKLALLQCESRNAIRSVPDQLQQITLKDAFQVYQLTYLLINISAINLATFEISFQMPKSEINPVEIKKKKNKKTIKVVEVRVGT